MKVSWIALYFESHVYWTVRHLDSWIKRDQLDVTCFIISLFNAQHVSDVNTSNLRSLRLICWVISWVVLLWFDACWCYVVVWLGWCGIRMQASVCVRIPHASNQSNTTHEITQQISRKLLRMDVLTSETCWAVNNGIKSKRHQVGLSPFNSILSFVTDGKDTRCDHCI